MECQEKVVVCGSESRLEPSDDHFHFRVAAVPSEPLLSREYAFRFDWLQPVSHIFLPEVQLEHSRFILHFGYTSGCLSCYLSYTDAQHQQTLNGNFCSQFLSKYFEVRLGVDGEEVLAEKFVSLFRTGQTESVRFCEKDISLERGCKVTVEVSMTDNCTYPLCLQYLCPCWNGVYSYKEKHQKQRFSEFTFRKVNRKRNSECLEKKANQLDLDLKTDAFFHLTEECFEHEGCPACTSNQELAAFVEMVPESVLIHLAANYELEVGSESSLLLLAAHYYLHKLS